jgi:RecB family endonuclease NucS
MAIIFSKKGQSTQKIEKSGFGPERNLQQYIHENPEAIPLYDIQRDKRLFVVTREFPTGSLEWIDALAVDRDGDIYIVETKLYANADKRRVVAQVLDYGCFVVEGVQ